MYLDGQGTRHYYVYDPTLDTDQAIDLASIIQGMPEGYELKSTGGLNEGGFIAVNFESISGDDEIVGIIDSAAGYQFREIPNPVNVLDLQVATVTPRDINSTNDVLIVTRSVLSDGSSYFQTFLASYDDIGDFWSLEALTDWGEFSGFSLSERLPTGDFFVSGGQRVDGFLVPSRINLAGDRFGEFVLTPTQIDSTSYHYSGCMLNSWGGYRGHTIMVTERTRGKTATTSETYGTYWGTDGAVVHEDEFEESWGLNDDMDFIAYVGGFQVLKHQDRAESITINNAIDRSTTTIAWDTPELWLEFLDLGERWVFDEENPANNYPPIAGYVVIGPDNGSSPVPQGFILTPIVQ
jgi:hypothetical protein